MTHVVTDLDIGKTGTGLDVAKLVPTGIPLMIITGLPKSDELRQCAEQNYTVLSKPFDFETLENTLLQIESA